MSKSNRQARRATIVLRDGRAIVADDARWRGWKLHFTGRLRVRDAHGERFYETRTYAVPRSRVLRVDWHRDRSAA